MEGCVIAGGAEVFGVDCSGLLASGAFFDFGFPVERLVAGVAEAFGVVFFFLRAIATLFYHHLKNKSVRI